MNRRNFLKNTSLATFTLPAIGLSGMVPLEEKNKDNSLDTPEISDWEEITVTEVQQRMKNGQLTARALTEYYLKRIETLDKKGPKINSVIEVNPDALSIADAMDRERKQGKLRGPLHGIPVLIKDNIDTADKMQTTAGSLALAGHRAAKDAFIAQKLRQAGAVILGKTNLSEWANFRSTRSSSGWSSRGGQTNNPYNITRNPCGSSSGSGAAVSANLCTVAIGTETDGSIVCPSSVNGVVGLKPTVGLLSRSGIIPISHTQDTAGPMTRTVKDAAILLSALTGVDPQDEATKESAGKIATDYTQFLNANGLQGKRLGIDKSYLKGHEGVDALLQKALNQLRSKGATIVEVDLVSKFKELGDSEFQVLLYEFKSDLNMYLSTAGAKVKSLKDIIEFNKQNEARVMPYFKQEIMEMAEAKGDLNSEDYQKALKKNLATSRNNIDTLLSENHLDAIIGPTTGPSWCTDLVNGDHFSGYDTSSPAAIAGYPHITVPMGMVYGLPIGLSFFGMAYNEGGLLSLAYAYEQVSQNRVAPKPQALNKA